MTVFPCYRYYFIYCWNTYIKTNFTHQSFGDSEIQVLQERQETCVILSFQNNKSVHCILQKLSVNCVLWGFLKKFLSLIINIWVLTYCESALLSYCHYPDLCLDCPIFGQTRLIFVGSGLPLPYSRSFRMPLCSLAR